MYVWAVGVLLSSYAFKDLMLNNAHNPEDLKETRNFGIKKIKFGFPPWTKDLLQILKL